MVTDIMIINVIVTMIVDYNKGLEKYYFDEYDHPVYVENLKKESAPQEGTSIYKHYRLNSIATHKNYLKSCWIMSVSGKLFQVELTFHVSECKNYWRCNN